MNGWVHDPPLSDIQGAQGLPRVRALVSPSPWCLWSARASQRFRLRNSLGTCVWHASVARQLSKGAPATASAADILMIARARSHVKQPERETLNLAGLSREHEQVQQHSPPPLRMRVGTSCTSPGTNDERVSGPSAA